MTRLLEQALETIRKLPDPVQDDLARLLLEIADSETQRIELTPDEAEDLAEALAEVERGEFASDEAIHALWAKYERYGFAIPPGRRRRSTPRSPMWPSAPL